LIVSIRIPQIAIIGPIAFFFSQTFRDPIIVLRIIQIRRVLPSANLLWNSHHSITPILNASITKAREKMRVIEIIIFFTFSNLFPGFE